MHLTPSSVCCLARLSLMHLFVGVRKKNKTPAYLPRSRFAQKCCQVEPDRCGGLDQRQTTPSLSSLIPPYKSLSITAAAVVPLVSVCRRGRWGRTFGREEGRGGVKRPSFLQLETLQAAAACVVHHALTYRRPPWWSTALARTVD